MATKQTIDWGEQADEDYLPPTTVEGPDAKGIKIVTEYKKTSDSRVKVTKKIKVTTRTRKVSKKISERKKWPRFVYQEPGMVHDDRDVATFLSTDEIKIETPEEEAAAAGKDAGQDIMDKLKASLLQRQMKKRLAEQGIITEDEPKGLRRGTPQSRGETERTPGKYVPPGARGGGGGNFPERQEEETKTIRVTNISEEASQESLEALFRRFGSCQRVYVARDRETQVSRGFAYVTYYNRADAELAKSKLNGHGYDHLILKVEWAKPSVRDDVGSQNVMKYASGYGKALPQGL